MTTPPKQPEVRPVLVAFTDLEAFTRIVEKLKDPLAIFNLMDKLTRLIDGSVHKAGGVSVKTMGDSVLAVFDRADADQGVRAMIEVKNAVEKHLSEIGYSNHMRVTMHVGDAAIGPFGPDGRLDIYGEAVNRASLLGAGSYRGELILSPETFRALKPETRTLFKRHIRETVYRCPQ